MCSIGFGHRIYSLNNLGIGLGFLHRLGFIFKKPMCTILSHCDVAPNPCQLLTNNDINPLP